MSNTTDGTTKADESNLLEIFITAYGENPHLPSTLLASARHIPRNIKVTVLDDATQSDYVAMCCRRHRDRIRYRRNPRRLGVGGTFNAAISQSRAHYTLLLGHDDLPLPGLVPALLDEIRRGDFPAAIHAGAIAIDARGRRSRNLTDWTKHQLTPRPGILSGQALVTSLMLGNWMYLPAVAWRTEDVRRFPFDGSMLLCMDLDVTLRLAFSGHAVRHSTGPGILYRRHVLSVSSQSGVRDRLHEELELHRRVSREAVERGWWQVAATAWLAPSARLNSAVRLVARRMRGLTARARQTHA